MKILHYFLGFPPYRTGGLTKYAYDLMIEQHKRGDEIIAVWPGEIGFINKEVRYREKRTKAGIKSIEIINPLPVSLDEGIIDIKAYTKSTNTGVFIKLFKRYNPDVIHIHTLMGMYREFVEAANILNIKTVFTTHDYFGICPKVTLYHDGNVCENDHDCRDCIDCNKSALSIRKIMIMQSFLYRIAKNTVIVKKLRNEHRKEFFNEAITEKTEELLLDSKFEDYRQLRNYYKSILEEIDLIHFNSLLAKEIYERYITPKQSCVLSITHKSILDHREEANWEWTGKLRITCLAPARPYKGFNTLKTALDQLWAEGKRNFCLNLFTPVPEKSDYMIIKEEGFTQSQLGDIFANTDVLIAPSIWYETFGFTVLEALSYGVPVIISNHVGSKDIVKTGGIIVDAGKVEALKKAIESLNENNLRELRKSISKVDIQLWPDFIDLNNKLYLGISS